MIKEIKHVVTLFLLSMATIQNAIGQQVIAAEPYSYLESALPDGGSMDVNDDGDTTDTIYWVDTIEHLLWISETSSAWRRSNIYLQAEDIDLSGTQYWDDADDDGNGNKFDDPNDLTNEGNNEGWLPIAFTSIFSGVYNGDYRRIISMTINRPSANRPVGFISMCSGAFGTTSKVMKLGFVDGYVHGGTAQVGGIIGYVQSISNTTIIDEVLLID